MDTLTHLALGATIGEAMLGRRAGGRAMAWGAAAGTMPDVDVLIGALLPELQEVALHRGYTHSLVFAFVAAPMVAMLPARWHARTGVSWRSWAALILVSILAHILVDLFNTYGVRPFLPFSNEPLAVASVAIVDPLFTLPLLGALLGSLVLRRQARMRQAAACGALFLCASYLSLTLVSKSVAESAFQEGFQRAGLAPERILVKPTLFNNVLWRAIAEVEGGYHVAFYSHLDGGPPESFRWFPHRRDQLETKADTEAVQTLEWLTWGWLQAVRQDEKLIINDMRFGTGSEWLGTVGPMAFSYRVEAGGESISHRPRDTDATESRERLAALWDRILGHAGEGQLQSQGERP